MINEYLNKIIKGDSIEVLKKLPDNSVDLIFADPPYNLQLNGDLWRPNQTKVDAVNDEWDKFTSFEKYDKFCEAWIKECKRILKKDGSIWIIGSYHNIFRVGKIMQDVGLWVLNDILWIKTNPMPNFKGTRFNNAHETLIWASKEQNSKFTFHYKTMKAFNDDLQMRSDWYIPICNGGERLKDEKGNKAHSTQKPEALLYRIIISTSNPGDVVLDPFMGSGTTGAIAKKLGRNFIGIEREDKYIEVANKRIAEATPYKNQTLKYPFEAKKPKVPFGNLIEMNFIKAGEKLISKNRKFEAEVLANATIQSKDISGSIHSVSAKLLNKASNNGWTFWFVERDNNLKSIDDLREEYAKKYITLKGDK
tara:strand:- start:977 stop:2068 length:1092 start_codon:yes stop_codon:yes gene_type:complete